MQTTPPPSPKIKCGNPCASRDGVSYHIENSMPMYHHPSLPPCKDLQRPADPATLSSARPLFLNVIKLLAQDLVHCKHMNAILLEDRLHLVIATDLAFVGRVLQVSRFDILPYLLDYLGSRELRMLALAGAWKHKNTELTVGSPTNSARGALRWYCFCPDVSSEIPLAQRRKPT